MDMIGSLQLRVMHHIWKHGECTVHQVHDALNAEPDAAQLAYTTILTVMRNLAKRDILDQKRTGRSHVFAPLIGEREYKGALLQHLCETFFEGDCDLMCSLLRESVEAAR